MERTYVNWNGTATDLGEWSTEKLQKRMRELADLTDELRENDDDRLPRVSINLAGIVSELIDRDAL